MGRSAASLARKKQRAKERRQTPEYKARQREQDRARYRNDPQYRARKLASAKRQAAKPEVKARRQTPEYKAREKAKRQTPEYRANKAAYMAEYIQRPGVRERLRVVGNAYRRNRWSNDPEYRARQRDYRQRPEVKARARARQQEYWQRPEVKARAAARNRRWRKSTEGRAWGREYRQRPEVKARNAAHIRRWRESTEGRAWLREYGQRPEVKAKRREYRNRPEVKASVNARLREYEQRPEVKAKRREYYNRPEVKARVNAWHREYNRQPDVYSKLLERSRRYWWQTGRYRPRKGSRVKPAAEGPPPAAPARPPRQYKQSAAARAKQSAYYARPDVQARLQARKESGQAQDAVMRSIYGITMADKMAMLAVQGGRCAICDAAQSGGKSWHIDHNHATGELRGVLCMGCNHGLGSLRDHPAVLERAAGYLRERGHYSDGVSDGYNPDRWRGGKRRRRYLTRWRNRLLAEQNRRCAICGDALADGRARLDHNHATGELRGVLCNTCNNGLGKFGDDPAAVELAAAYLRERGWYGADPLAGAPVPAAVSPAAVQLALSL